MSRRLTSLLAAAAALLGAACDRVPASAVTSCESEVRIGASATDILFVIDESQSMYDDQQTLRDGLYAFLGGLASSPVHNDFRIGVTTTSVEDWSAGVTWYTDPASPNLCPSGTSPSQCTPFPAGALVAVARDQRGAPIPGELVWDPAAGFGGARVLDAGSPTLLADFQANVLVGQWGTGKEQPFRAARRALEALAAPGAANAGFLRPGARLALVFLSDEDDCSGPTDAYTDCRDRKDRLDPVSDLVAFLEGPIAGERRRPVVAAIAGFDQDLQPTGCNVPPDALGAHAPTRYAELLDGLGPGRSLRASICDADFSAALLGIAELIIPRTVPLERPPPDWRMLVISVIRADGEVVACPIAEAGTPDAAGAGVVYVAPQAGAPATITFQGACTLGAYDRVDLRMVCAG